MSIMRCVNCNNIIDTDYTEDCDGVCENCKEEDNWLEKDEKNL